MAPRKPKPWQPPPGLKIGIRVGRGDCTFEAEATPADALNVARLLTVMARQLTHEAPDLLPHAESVPGAVLGYDWAEEYAGEAQKTVPKRVGF